MSSLSWLHLSDFHQGMSGHRLLWPNIRERILDDLEALHDVSGPWDVVFFTGDLTQRGSPEEFDQFEEVMGRLFEHLRHLGSRPAFLAVPGNHDLSRPDSHEARAFLKRWSQEPEVREAFWREAGSPHRRLVEHAFANYEAWWKKTRMRRPDGLTRGHLPGDFSVTIENEGGRFGVLGLNTSFLQLADGDYQGKLALGVEQFHGSCGGDGPAWASSHDACLLLSHHPPDWLSAPAQKELREEIADPRRFAAHLFGHMHEGGQTLFAVVGDEPWRYLQAPSLFGLEHWGTPHQTRQHGYVSGRLDLRGDRGVLRLWPRAVCPKEGSWSIGPAHAGDELPPQEVRLRARRRGPTRKASADPLRSLIEGIGALPNDFSNRIHRFLVHYAGQEVGGGSPFGGRARELAELDQWLDDEGQPPYRLLMAPGGRGKSALLAHWVCGLASREGLDVAYFPVSVRFQTNLATQLFSSLGARLAWLRGERIPSDPHMLVEAWRRRVVDMLEQGPVQDRQLLVVIDGLDEAADLEIGPTLFPFKPLPGLRIVLSAREMTGWDPDRWFSELGWTPPGLAAPMTLGLLAREEIVEVLGRLGPPLERLARDLRVIDELHRLTRGDPLLLKLYLDKLSRLPESASLAEQLRDLEPGLAGYFESWWHEQRKLWGRDARAREDAVNELLGLLACALGPLKRDELLRLWGSRSGLGLDRTLEPLARLIVGDGQQQGIAFTHPGLATYFETRLSPDERRSWAAQFLAWGASTLEQLGNGSLKPKDVPPYLIQYYGAHLEKEAREPEAFRLLVSEVWRQAVESHERSYAGFLNDVERTRNAFHRSNRERISRGLAPALAEDVRCALVRASIHALAKNLRPTVLRAFLSTGSWTLEVAHSYARSMPDTDACVDALLVLVECAPESQRDTYLHEALSVARSSKDFLGLNSALDRIGRQATPSFLPTLMNGLEEAYGNVESRLLALESLARHQPASVQPLILERARALVSTLGDTDQRERWERNLESGLGRRWDGWPGGQRAVWGDEVDPSDIPKIFSELAAPPADRSPRQGHERTLRHAWEQRFKERMKGLSLASGVDEPQLESLLAHACGFTHPEAQAYVLVMIAPGLPPRLLREAWEITRGMEDRQVQAEVMTALVPRVAEEEWNQALEELKEAAFAISDADQVLPAVAAIASHLPEPDRTRLLRSVWDTRSLVRGAARANTLAGLLVFLPEEEQRETLFEVMTEASERAGTPWEPLISRLAPVLGRFPKAWSVFNAGRTGANLVDRVSTETLEAIAPFVPDAWLGAMWRVALEDRHAERWWQLLRALGPRLSLHRQRAVFKELCSSANEARCMLGLSALAPHLHESLVSRALKRLSAHRGQFRFGLLDALWPRLSNHPRALRKKLLEDSCELARELELGLRERAFRMLSVPLAEMKGEDAIDFVDDIPIVESQVGFLVELMDLLPQARERILREALDRMALGLDSTQAWALARLVSHVPESQLPRLVEVAKGIREDEHRAVALGAVASRLPPKRRDELWAEALRAATEGMDQPLREDPFPELVPLLSRLPRESLYLLWEALLPRLATQTRADFLKSLEVLAPVLLALGGKEELAGIVWVVLEIGHWWA